MTGAIVCALYLATGGAICAIALGRMAKKRDLPDDAGEWLLIVLMCLVLWPLLLWGWMVDQK